eukprot:gene1436-6009_t
MRGWGAWRAVLYRWAMCALLAVEDGHAEYKAPVRALLSNTRIHLFQARAVEGAWMRSDARRVLAALPHTAPHAGGGGRGGRGGDAAPRPRQGAAGCCLTTRRGGAAPGGAATRAARRGAPAPRRRDTHTFVLLLAAAALNGSFARAVARATDAPGA